MADQLEAVETKARGVARRRAFNLWAGSIGLGTAAVLIYPKVMALSMGGLEVLGTGSIANLALIFGSLMFLREARKAKQK